MGVSEVFEGLAHSAFIADVDDRDRHPGKIAATLVGGITVALIALIACFILILVIWTIAAGYGGEGVRGIGRLALAVRNADGRDLNSSLLVLVLTAPTNVAFALAFVGLAALLARHRFGEYLTAAPAFRWRLLLAGLVLSLIVIGPMVAMDRAFTAETSILPLMAVSPDVLGRTAYVLAAIAFLIPAAAAEELFFRGWLLRQLAAFTRRPGVLIAVTAAAFALIHFDFSPGALLTRGLMGAGFAYMTLRLGGIELSTGVHAANNILVMLFVEPLTLSNLRSASELSAGSLLEDVALVVAYLLITESVVRIEPLRRWAGVRRDELSRRAEPAAAF